MKKRVPGFSLVETLVAMGALTVILTSLYFFVSYFKKVQDYSLEQSLAITEARNGIETMVKEIREIQIANNGAYPIVTADDNTFIFYSDIDKDNSIERVRYFLDGTQFKKGTIEPRTNPVMYVDADEIVTTITSYVNNTTTPVFTYYNGNWPSDTANNPLTTPANPTMVKYITIQLVINVAPAKAPQDFHLISDVAIRNLKENL